MTPAIFGITNGTLNLFVSLLVLSLVAMWIALIYRAFMDAERRIEDPVLVRILPLWSIFPFIGSVIYSIIRPPEYLEDMREREVETKAAEARLAMLRSRTCRNCGYEVEPSYLRCPSCLRKLKEPCEDCGKPLDPRWRVCPFCEVEVKRAAPTLATTRRGRVQRSAEHTKAPAERASGGRPSAALRPRVTEAEPKRAVPPASERQRRSLSSVDVDRGETTPRPVTDERKPAKASDTAEQRLSVAAAIGPKRQDPPTSSNSEAPAKPDGPAKRSKESAGAAKARSTRPRTSGSKKTPSGSRTPRKQ